MTITLYTFGRMFGLPDASPFVIKAELLLTMAGLPFALDTKGFTKAPKGKLPYLRDGDTVIADSTLIRWHLERRHGIDFDAGYGPRDKAIGWAVEKMLEEQLYWPVVHARWVDEANFEKGPARFFDGAPAPVRPLIKTLVKRKVRANLKAQGTGRHRRSEIEALGIRSIEALSDILGDKPFILGDTVSGTDASVYGAAASLLCPVFDTPLRDAAAAKPNLVAYEARMRAQYFPDLPPLAAASPLSSFRGAEGEPGTQNRQLRQS